MPTRIPAIFSWSGGKDSAYALHTVLSEGRYEVKALLTSVNRDYGRISMHGVRESLLEAQAASIGIPLVKSYIGRDCTSEEYESSILELLQGFVDAGVTTVIHGDLYLQDIRDYREKLLAKIGMVPVFPLWGRNTKELIHQFIYDGFGAITTCIDTRQLDGAYAGRLMDRYFVESLPSGVDPCGENGEYHSFVFDGPIFAEPIEFAVGRMELRDGRFLFCDLIEKTT